MATNGLLSSPLLNIGLGLLSQRGRPEGLSSGLLNAQKAAYQQQIMDQMRHQQEQLASQQDARRQLASQLSASPVPGSGPLNANPQAAYAADPMQQAMLQNVATGAPGAFDQMVQNQVAPPIKNPPSELQMFNAFRNMSPQEQDSFLKYRQAAAMQINNIPKPEAGYMYKNPTNPQEGVVPIPGGSKEQGTGEQNKAAGFTNRMVTSEHRMMGVTSSGYNPTNPVDAYGQKIPGIGNYIMSTEGQTYRQAQEDWVRAKLRKESGAVIGEEEMANEIKTYFPQPGDRPEVVAAKQKARVEAIRGVYGESEGQFDRKFGKNGTSMLQSLLKGAESTPPMIPAGMNESEQDRIYESFPSGTVFIGPDGVKRRKP